jgi:hypothetical protein
MATVKSQQLREYLETFHRVYLEKLNAAVPEEYRNFLLRVRHLAAAKVVGYVSTIHGVGYEYCAGSPGEIEVVSGSRRIEEFIFRYPRGLMEGAVSIAILLRAPRLRMISCSVENMIPVKLDSPDASATLESFELRFRGNIVRLEFAEIFADRSAEFWSREKAIERAMDEVLEAVIYVSGMQRHKMSLDDYLERFKKGHVLILGDFSETGSSRIETIAAVLTSRGYYAFTLKDIKEVPEYDLRQKLSAVAAVCRFIVVDDSSRAGQAAEIPTGRTRKLVACSPMGRGWLPCGGAPPTMWIES